MTAPERFADSRIPLAPRAPSIHDPGSGRSWRNSWGGIGKLPGHSGFMPENLITLAHFSPSSTRSLPKSAGEPGSTVPPKAATRPFSLGSASPALISVLSLSMILAGVPGSPNAEERARLVTREKFGHCRDVR